MVHEYAVLPLPCSYCVNHMHVIDCAMSIAGSLKTFVPYYVATYVTESAKTGLICTNYTYSIYHIYLFSCVGYTISVSFIEFLRKLCVYNEIFDKILAMLGKRVI